MNRLAACEHCGEDVWYDDRADQWNHNEDDIDDHEAKPDEYDEQLAERDARNEAADQLRDQWELKRGSTGALMNLRTAAIDFLAEQNTGDREELLFRAHRHASNLTGQLPVPVAQRVVQSFVATVNREILAEKDKINWDQVSKCEGGKCDHTEPTEDGDDAWAEAHDNPHVPKKKSHRTAAISDFPDELMF